MTGLDVRAVAEAVAACPDVAGLSGGVFGEAATYLPGDRVVGVREDTDGIEIRIVARWGRPLPQIAEQVRKAVRAYAGGAPVTVAIDDIEIPAEPGRTPGAGRGAAFHQADTPARLTRAPIPIDTES